MGRGEPWKLNNDDEKGNPKIPQAKACERTSKDESQQELNKSFKVDLGSREVV